MIIEQQKELINIYEQYQNTDHKVIKTNLINVMKGKEIQPSELSQITNIPVQTLYQYRKVQVNLKPSFIDLLYICQALNIALPSILLNVDIKNHQWKNTKWTITAKQKYCMEFQKMSITEITKSYNITQRTAQEYYKMFSRELKEVNNE